MTRNTRIVIALLLVGAAFMAAIFYLASARSAAQTAEALATVVRSEREAKKGDDDTIVTLSYPTGTGEAQGRARVDGVRMAEFPAGRQVRVCYDPSTTTSVRIADGPCG